MQHFAIFLSFIASAMTAAVPPSLQPPLPIGEIGWQGSVTPGGPMIEVWGQSFEVRDPLHPCWLNYSGTQP